MQLQLRIQITNENYYQNTIRPYMDATILNARSGGYSLTSIMQAISNDSSSNAMLSDLNRSQRFEILRYLMNTFYDEKLTINKNLLEYFVTDSTNSSIGIESNSLSIQMPGSADIVTVTNANQTVRR